MAISFTRAIRVQRGDPITSTQMRSLARALRDRLLSGIGDGAWRLVMEWINLFRLMRNPSEDGLTFPAMAEALEIFNHLTPEMGFEWPEQGPGLPEGANLANVVNQFIWGLGDFLAGEEGRLNFSFDDAGIPHGLPLWLAGRPPETPGEIWALRQAQKGVVIPGSTIQYVPALEAAQSVFKIVTPLESPHGKSYGGFRPSPVKLLDSCGSTIETGLGIQSYQVFFTAKVEPSSTAAYHGSVGTDAHGRTTITYAGSCPLGTDNTAVGHVVGMARLPFSTLVAVNNGTDTPDVDHFPTSDWIEGPYTGVAHLGRDPDGGQLSRSLWWYACNFRGTEAQRKDTPDEFDIEDIAFDFEAFSSRQYQLAPNLGRMSGDQIEGFYPHAEISGPQTGGQILSIDGVGGTLQYLDGFVLSAFYVRAEKLAGEVRVELLDGEAVIWSTALQEDPSGVSEVVIPLAEAATAPNLSIRLASTLRFTEASGKLIVECDQSLAYKPNWWDFYLLLRMASTRGGDVTAAGVDGDGTKFDDAKGLWTDYETWGCILNGAAPGVRMQADWVNDHPVYDSARKLCREMMRVVARRQFHSYEVTGGKSVLRYYRYVRNVPSIPPDTLDVFEFIAPRAAPAVDGELVIGEEYIVRGTAGSASVMHAGQSYMPDQRLIATSTDFKAKGDGQLFVYNGIRTIALPTDWTNEWCAFPAFKRYHPSESSMWKADVHADFYPINQRCLHGVTDAANVSFIRHTTYGSRSNISARTEGSGYNYTRTGDYAWTDFLAVEAPSGYTYALGANSHFDFPDPFRANFYTSCQIYKAPYEVESALIEIEGGEEIVKLTFKTRFDSHPDAPATVDKDPNLWSGGDVTALQAEAYRTDDNAFREYSLHISGAGDYQGSIKIGDAGARNAINTIPDNPFGAIYPHFFLVRLPREPFEDGNDVLDKSDSRCVVDSMIHCEMLEHAMSEGFVDGQTSLLITCETGDGSLYDYQWRNLNFEAHGGTSPGAFSLALRSDRPDGFGALPNTLMYADVFNRLVDNVNLLTRARVMLPFEVQCKIQQFNGYAAITPTWPSPAPDCGAAEYYVWYTGCPPVANTLVLDGDWDSCGSGAVAVNTSGILSQSGNLDGFAERCPDAPAASPRRFMYTFRQKVQYKVVVSPDAELAIPIAWRSQVADIGGFVGTFRRYSAKATAREVTAEADSMGCCAAYQSSGTPCAPKFWDGVTGKGLGPYYESMVVTDETECRLISAGTLAPTTPPCGSPFVDANDGSGHPCGNISYSGEEINIYTDPGFIVTVPLVDLV